MQHFMEPVAFHFAIHTTNFGWQKQLDSMGRHVILVGKVHRRASRAVMTSMRFILSRMFADFMPVAKNETT